MPIILGLTFQQLNGLLDRADRPRSGRPRVTSRRQDRTIRLAHLRNRHLTATETALNTVGTHNRQISPKTVGRSRLREIGLRARRPYVGLPLTQARMLRRMAWLTAHAPRLGQQRQQEGGGGGGTHPILIFSLILISRFGG